jgi:hypothetical protein
MQCVDIVDILLPFINFSLDPMSIEIAEEMVDIFGGNCVTPPFFDIESEQRLVGVGLAFIHKAIEMVLEVINELVVEFFP